MAAGPVRLSGEEWQGWANQLLAQRYGPAEYQKVPDNMRGDAGLEGFTLTAGHAYQAYGCEEPISAAERYEKQRNKMTRDISKFVKNRTILISIFGQVKIARWVLLVPHFDSKELVAHAATKTSEIHEANLPYVAAGFRVVVSDEDEFQVERDCLLRAAEQRLTVRADDATQDQINDWTDQHDSFVMILDGKIRKLPALVTPEKRKEFRCHVLKWYLEGQDILASLRSYPEVYEKVMAAKLHRENYLATTALINSGSPKEVLQAALTAYMNTVQDEAKMLATSTVESLAHEAVADWMLRCPLDFPES